MIDKLKTSPHVKRATELMNTNKLRERLISKQYIDKKKKELQERMNMPPFVRTIDKLCVLLLLLFPSSTPPPPFRLAGGRGGHLSVEAHVGSTALTAPSGPIAEAS
jgi:hypothetical protein